MTVDLERLRRSLARYAHAEESAVPVAVGELEALVAVVDAARAYADGASLDVLAAALEPFTPPADPSWKEVDRWRDLTVKAAVDAAKPNNARMTSITFPASGWGPQNPRDRARDQLADAGVAAQRQFRSDQERIAELERRVSQLSEWYNAEDRKTRALVDAVEQAIRLLGNGGNPLPELLHALGREKP